MSIFCRLVCGALSFLYLSLVLVATAVADDYRTWTDLTGKYWSIGAVYDVLDRLTRKGLVSTVVSDPVKARGGKSKRFYRITKSGFKALEEVRTLQQKAWVDLPKPALNKN